MSLKYYFYIDEEKVNSLYNQISKNITNKKVTKLKADRDDTNLQMGIGLKNIFDSEIKQSSEYENTLSIETQIEITIEEKINKLLQVEEISQTNNLRICEALELIKNKNDFIYCQGIFNLVRLYKHKKNGKFEIIDNPKSIIISQNNLYWIFHYGTTEYNKQFIDNFGKFNRDNNYRLWEYYQDYTSPYGVEMCLDGINMRRKVLSLNSEIELGKSFKFYIIGKMEFKGGNFYSLIPIAIWQ